MQAAGGRRQETGGTHIWRFGYKCFPMKFNKVIDFYWNHKDSLNLLDQTGFN
jgi:hypothetical protein